MAETSITNLIVLIVSLGIAVGIGGVVLQSADMISNSIRDKGYRLSTQLDADISIINDPEYMIENVNGENVVVLYVKNIGSITLENEKKYVDVFLDGEYVAEENIWSMEVIGENRWVPHSVLRIVTSYSQDYLGAGDHKAKVVTFNTEDSIKFRL